MSATSALTTTTGTAAQATSTAACSNLYDTPVDDAVCGMPDTGNYTTLMFSCCGAADVVSYYGGCGLYCLAVGQSVADLSDCLYEQGAAWEDVFCRGDVNATATATAADLPASASASVLSSARATSTASSQSGRNGTSSDDKDSAAPAIMSRSVSVVSLLVASLAMSAALM